jgi:PKD repeat protein
MGMATGITATHTYTEVGDYLVTLAVENCGGGNMATKAYTVTVVALDIVDVTYEMDGLEVTFDADVSGTEPITYTWDFGDGTGWTGTTYTVTHVYTDDICYTVTLTATNAAGEDTWSEEICLCLPVEGVDFTWDPETGVIDEPVMFTATEPITGTAPFSYTWDFGDEMGMATGITATHTYTAVGDYLVTLTVENCGGDNMAMKQYTVTVAALDIVDVTYEIDGWEVTFDADVSGARPITYTWDFGDGEDWTGTTPTVTHEYAAGGCYTVVLTATNAAGSDSWTGEVCLCVPVEGVDFGWDPETGIAGEEIAFTAAEPLTGTAPFIYTWDFGDETGVGMGMMVTHVYEAAGVYTVTLTVENECGMAMVEYVVTVEPAIMEIYLPVVLKNS